MWRSLGRQPEAISEPGTSKEYHAQAYKEKLDRENRRTTSSLVSDRYSGISNIEFYVTYYRRGLNEVLMTHSLNFSPSDYAAFPIKCKHDGCINGEYDLAVIVVAIVKGRKEPTSGKFFCHERTIRLVTRG